MIALSEAEKQLLTLVREIAQHTGTPHREALEKLGNKHFDEELVDWTEAFESLAEKGLLQEKDGVFSVTKRGEPYAEEVHRQFSIRGFSKALIQSDQSATHGMLCERLHGKNLSQFNMMDMEQLNTLLDTLNLNENNRVLDMGCGIGRIAEYISDVTKAHITGIDFAKLGHVLNKHNLKFQTWDFTKSEHGYWKNSKKFIEELRQSFEVEGNIDLYNMMIEESEHILTFVNSGRISRYLYHVRL